MAPALYVLDEKGIRPMTDPIELVPGKTDAEKAAAYRAEMLPVLKQVCDIIQRARFDGLIIGWDNIGIDQFGRTVVPPINVTKPL